MQKVLTQLFNSRVEDRTAYGALKLLKNLAAADEFKSDAVFVA